MKTDANRLAYLCISGTRGSIQVRVGGTADFDFEQNDFFDSFDTLRAGEGRPPETSTTFLGADGLALGRSLVRNWSKKRGDKSAKAICRPERRRRVNAPC
jgi:hypothetical protein